MALVEMVVEYLDRATGERFDVTIDGGIVWVSYSLFDRETDVKGFFQLKDYQAGIEKMVAEGCCRIVNQSADWWSSELEIAKKDKNNVVIALRGKGSSVTNCLLPVKAEGFLPKKKSGIITDYYNIVTGERFTVDKKGETVIINYVGGHNKDDSDYATDISGEFALKDYQEGIKKLLAEGSCCFESPKNSRMEIRKDIGGNYRFSLRGNNNQTGDTASTERVLPVKAEELL